MGRLPLYLSFLLIVLVSSVMVGFITYLVQEDSVVMQVRQAQQERINQRLIELQGTINDFNRRGDHNSIHRAIARLSVDPTLKALVVIDRSGRVRFSSVIDYRNRLATDVGDIDLIAAGSPVDSEYGGVYFDAESNWVIGSFPLDRLTDNGGAFPGGGARLLGVFDIRDPLARAVSEQEHNIVQQVLIFVVVLALGFLLLYGNIRTRIDRIIGTAHAFIAGDFASRIGMKGNDEFASIARTLDQMAGEIETQHSDLNKLAHFDALTQLPNRKNFLDRLIQLTGSKAQQEFSILFIDLDRFKVVNDSLGHQVGDEMLQVIAHRIRSCVKDGDTVARFGGDEFLVLLPGAEEQVMVVAILGRLLRHIAQPMLLDGRPVTTTASIGVARYPRDGQTASILIQRADIAMYQAKAHGKNTYHFYRPEIDELSPDRLSLEHHLRQCILNDEVVPYFQPIFDTRRNLLVGLEALARMPDGKGGLLAPDLFIPVMEEAGLMADFGPVMMRRAMLDYQDWLEHCALKHSPYLAINLSCSQLDQDDFLSQVDNLLNDVGINPQLIEFEITEGTIIRHVDQKQELLGALRQRGIRIAVDDFGTGYSSLSYLKKLPLDTLKIDRSFVRDINLDVDDNAIIETIIAMANKLRLGVVAEGVETAEQLAFLQARNCDVIQGYYIGRPSLISELPQDATEISSLLQDATEASSLLHGG